MFGLDVWLFQQINRHGGAGGALDAFFRFSPREMAVIIVLALTGAGARAYAAQQNAWEALPVFGFSVFVAVGLVVPVGLLVLSFFGSRPFSRS